MYLTHSSRVPNTSQECITTMSDNTGLVVMVTQHIPDNGQLSLPPHLCRVVI